MIRDTVHHMRGSQGTCIAAAAAAAAPAAALLRMRLRAALAA